MGTQQVTTHHGMLMDAWIERMEQPTPTPPKGVSVPIWVLELSPTKLALAVAVYVRENTYQYCGSWPLLEDGLAPSELVFSRTRKRALVEARVIAAALIKRLHPKMSLESIGAVFQRDHSTTIHMMRRHREWLTVDPMFKQKWEGVLQHLNIELP